MGILEKCENMKKLVIFYLVYFLISGVFIFNIKKDVSDDFKESLDTTSFYNETEGEDRVIIFDNPLESGLARLYLIETAKETLDVAYFSIEEGETSNVFFGALFDAADRGVNVNVILDGMFHGLRMNKRPIIYAIANHPNMTLKFYEKFNPLLPWTMNNRMHDKYVLVDGTYALIGGRNIGDKYFAPQWYEKEVTNDRDVLIYNLENKDSVISEMKTYFNEIWDHKYSKDVLPVTRFLFKKTADKKVNELQSKAHIAKEMYQDQFDRMPDLKSISQKTNKVSFIHNPITRFNKEPWVWSTLTTLMKDAKESVFIQSPYTIPSKKMTEKFIHLDQKKITLLTNSLKSTPNLPAFSGYLNYRNKMVDQGIDILELQSKDSLHSKAFVYDKELVAIGSFNLDPRSAFLSTESMVVIHSEEAVAKFGLNIFNYTDHSLLVDKDGTYKENPDTLELQAPFMKRLLYKIFSFFVKPFENLL